MNHSVASVRLPQKKSSVAEVSSVAHLDRVLRRGTNVCALRRRLPAEMRAWLEALDLSGEYEASAQLRVDGAGAGAKGLLRGLGSAAGAALFAGDIEALARRFARITGAPEVVASLAIVHTDKCRKFHADYKPLRLLCTYLGPGTEWVDDADVDRAHLAQEVDTVELANARIVPRSSRIQRAKPGDVVILKGELHPGNHGRGAVHRSPPIQATGDRRLVLTLDTPA
jgi:hypothetical protein